MSDTGDTGPRLARPDEFPELLELVDRCFNAEPGGMRASNPHCYDANHPERHAIVEHDDRVIAHAACIPDTLHCGGGVTIPCPGISGVATDPRHAGEGHMGALLSFWIDRMEADDVPLARLWGDRARYGRFGFETVGRERHFCITARSFPDPPDRDEHVVRYDDADVETIGDLYERIPYRVSRTNAELRTLFEQRGLTVLLYRDEAAEDLAYLAFTSDRRDRVVTELAGDPVGVEGLIAYLFRAYYTDEVRVMVHPGDPIRRSIRPISVDWTDHTHKQLRVNHLPRVLRAFESRLASKLPSDPEPGEVTVGIEREAASVGISWNAAGDVDVRTVEGEPSVELTRAEAARLLFDDDDPEIEGFPETLRASALPFQFFVQRANWV